jgi:hypothetical protein
MGRTSLMMVIAFNLIFMVIGFRLSSITSSAYNKYITYYSIEQAGLAAESGANIAISNTFFARATPFDYTFPSGTGIAGTIQITKAARYGAGTDTIGFDLTVIGADNNSKVITTIRVQGASFSQWGMFTRDENGILWQTGDTCFGPFHTQDNINTNGTPRFYGLVTTNGRLISKNGTPYFKYPYTPNTNIPLDGNFYDLQTYGAAGGANYSGVKVFVQFHLDGKVTVRTTPATSTLDGWAQSGTGFSVGTIKKCTTYASVSALTSSGVLLVNQSELHVKGVLDGKITLGAIGTGSIVMLDSSVVYKDPPPGHNNPTAETDDMLGIVSQNNILVTDTKHASTSGLPPNYIKNYTPQNNNNNGDVTIHASMYSSTGGFGAENHANRGTCGTLTVVGGIQELERMAVGTVAGSGFLKSYDYDLNLQYSSPKGYPLTRFLIQNWVDSTIVLDKSFWQGENPLQY